MNLFKSIYWQAIFTAVMLLVRPAWGSDNQLIYSDQLNNGWANWGYNMTLNFKNATPVHSGSNCIAATTVPQWSRLSFVHDAVDASLYTNLTFWIHGGASGGQQLQILVATNNRETGFFVTIPRPVANAWQQMTFSLTSLGVATNSTITTLYLCNWSNTPQAPFYVDDVTLTAKTPPAKVHININSTQNVRVVNANVFGINQVAWDGNVYSPTSVSLLNDLGNPCLRWPGGSWGDGYHWTNEPGSGNRNWGSFSPDFIKLATNTQAQAFIICNYGSSDASEAAFGVRMFNLTNHCNFKYWEIGNEVGGSWETDNNTNPPWQPHDPWTYAMRFTNYYAQMKAVDPTIKIGAVADITEDGTSNYTNHPVVNPRTGVAHNGWTPVMLTYLRSNHITPDFLIEHKYPPSDGDTYNLLWSATWASDVASLRQMVTDYLGSAGTNVTLECTENGTTGDAQSVSLVGGLLYADSLGQVLQTELNSRLWWDMRNNGPDGGGLTNPDPALYGWRTNAAGLFYQDGGVVYSLGSVTNRYPKYYLAKLLTHFAAGGDQVVGATSDYKLLAAYAVKRTNGALSLLVINKSAATVLNAGIAVGGYQPNALATVYSYGIDQDEAARTNGPALAQDLATNSYSFAGTNFNYPFPPYSATVLNLSPAPPQLVVKPAPAGQFVFQVSGQPGVSYSLQYSTKLKTWATLSTITLNTNILTVTNAMAGQVRYYRAVWQP